MVETLSLCPLPKMHQAYDYPLGEAIPKTPLGYYCPTPAKVKSHLFLPTVENVTLHRSIILSPPHRLPAYPPSRI
jgi:hypothetical protein